MKKSHEKLRIIRIKPNYYVNVFFKMNTFSKDFVHYLSRDGVFLKAQKLNFCNFSPHFRPPLSPSNPQLFCPFRGLTSTNEIPTHPPSRTPQRLPFQGIASHQTFPLIPPCVLPASRPSRGIAPGRFLGKNKWNTLEIHPILELIFDISEQHLGLL